MPCLWVTSDSRGTADKYENLDETFVRHLRTTGCPEIFIFFKKLAPHFETLEGMIEL